MMLNINVGVLGHVDAGKTSLTKILSQTKSTAAFDKNPQSQERGITLDLGFSSFTTTTIPEALKGLYDKVQFTLVDCPGHASLIRTIIGGAQIIDFMLLVVDVTKGFQTQTGECLVIGEICCKKMIVVLNKVDLLADDKGVKRCTKKVQNTLSSTIFKDSPVVALSTLTNKGVDNLIQTMISFVSSAPIRNTSLPFLCQIDHCFNISGQGTVLTGTILQGIININDVIDIPALKVQKKVKTIQMFKKSMQQACAGDRVGLCITQFDAKVFERGLICSLNYVKESCYAICEAHKIKHYKNDVLTKSKFHVTFGHNTVMAVCTFFNTDFKYEDKLEETNNVLLEFTQPVLLPLNSIFIGSKLDADINANACRLAFWGTVTGLLNKNSLSNLKIYKTKTKTGFVDRLVNNNEIIVKNLFKKDSNLQLFIGLKIRLSTGETGIIESAFGQSGKVKVRINNALKDSTVALLNDKKNKTIKCDNVEVILRFKKYVFDTVKKIVQ